VSQPYLSSSSARTSTDWIGRRGRVLRDRADLTVSAAGDEMQSRPWYRRSYYLLLATALVACSSGPPQQPPGDAAPPDDGPVDSSPDLPPDPATVAPLLDRSVATSVFAASAFLYTGANPIQTGVDPATIPN
jgi:hypothetical protein